VGPRVRARYVACVLLGLASCPELADAATLPAGFRERVVLRGLTEPTAVDFARDGRVFVAEKSGIIRVFDGLEDPTPTVFADLRTNVHNYVDRGLLGLALHPDFPATPYVYVLYALDAPPGGTPPRYGTAGRTSDACSESGGCVIANRLARLEADGNTIRGPETVLIEDWCQVYHSHSAGGLVFGSDGALYAAAGDGATATAVDYGERSAACGDPPLEGGALRSQDLRTTGDPLGLNGSIVRVDPLSGSRRTVAYGLRNPFRITTRPGTGEIWIGDVGWEDWEEIDRVADAADDEVENFGWPCYEGDGRQPGYDAADVPLCESLYAETGHAASVAPVLAYQHGQPVVPGESCGTGDSAVSGLAFYAGGSYPPPFDTALFFADYSRSCIWAVLAGASGDPDPTRRVTFLADAARPVDLRVGPDGDLFYVDLVGGTVRRIEYFAGNTPPYAVLAADPTDGPLPLTVRFDASGSSDAESGTALTYAWDLDGDGAFDDSTEVAAVHTYAEAATTTVQLRVTDGGGATDEASVVITAGNSAPRPTIATPLGTTQWRVGQEVTFSGSATDPEDGPIPQGGLVWSLVLHHCPDDCHVHPVEEFPGVAAGAFTTLDHDYPSHLELRLTATDSGGLARSTSVILQPERVALTFVTEPPGLEVVVGSHGAPTPFVRDAIPGGLISVSAPSPQTWGGADYAFFAWSDGVAASHDVIAPPYPATYRARFLAASAAACAGTCGNGVVEPSCELCDHGTANCAPEACCAGECTADCRVAGRCTGSGACCTSTADCAAGEGCCGNGRFDEPAEECDDGNLLDGDCCSQACRREAAGCTPQTCPDLGPHLITPRRARTQLVRAPRSGVTRWRTRARFELGAGATIAPEAEDVELLLSEGGRTLNWQAAPAGAFRAAGRRCRHTWTLAERPAGWRTGRLRQQPLRGAAPDACRADVALRLRGEASAGMSTPAGKQLRQSIRIGDDCITSVLECRSRVAGKPLLCRSR
jgi:cysteine-rich repeat protein